MRKEKYTVENYAPKQYEKDNLLVNTVHMKIPYFLKNREDDIPEKRKILQEILGFKGLRTGPDSEDSAFKSLSKCKDSRINAVLKQSYFEANKRINNFGNPFKNFRSPYNPRNQKLEEKLKIEEDGQYLLF